MQEHINQEMIVLIVVQFKACILCENGKCTEWQTGYVLISDNYTKSDKNSTEKEPNYHFFFENIFHYIFIF